MEKKFHLFATTLLAFIALKKVRVSEIGLVFFQNFQLKFNLLKR
jgi:hypothetical protein